MKKANIAHLLVLTASLMAFTSSAVMAECPNPRLKKVLREDDSNAQSVNSNLKKKEAKKVSAESKKK